MSTVGSSTRVKKGRAASSLFITSLTAVSARSSCAPGGQLTRPSAWSWSRAALDSVFTSSGVRTSPVCVWEGVRGHGAAR